MFVALPVLAFVLLLVCLYSWPGSKLCYLSFRSSLLIAAVAWGGLSVLFTEVASLFGAVGPLWFISAWAFVVTLLSVASYRLRQKLQRPDVLSWFNLAKWPFGFLLFILLCALLSGLCSPPNTYDSQTYHLPRIEHWLVNGSVSPYPTNIIRQVGLPPFGEYFLLQLRATAGSNTLAALPQLLSFICLGVAASLIAQLHGLSKRAQLYAAVVCLTIPAAIGQASSTFNDLITADLILIAAWLALVLVKRPRLEIALFLGMAIGLALGVKLTSITFLAAIGCFALWRAWRIQLRAAHILYGSLVLLLAVILVMPVWLRNYHAFGSIKGPAILGSYGAIKHPSLGITVSNGIRTLSITSRTPLQIAPIDNANEDLVIWVHSLLGFSADDTTTTYVSSVFTGNNPSNDESNAPFPVHVMLLLGLTIATSIAYFKKKPLPSAELLWVAWFGFWGLCLLLKWQPWCGRFFLAWVGLASIPMAAYFDRTNTWFRNSMFTLLFFFGVVAAIKMNPRLIFSTKRGVFFQSAERLMFDNFPHQLPDYQKILAVTKDANLKKVSLYCTEDDCEYLLWWLSQRGDSPIMFSHWRPEGNLVYQPPNYVAAPEEYILVMRNELQEAMQNHAPNYRLVTQANSLSLYRRSY